MKLLTQTIPIELYNRLIKAGMPTISLPSPTKNIGGVCVMEAVDTYKIPSYSYVFDWLTEMGYIIIIAPTIDPDEYKKGVVITSWNGWVNGEIKGKGSWAEAANKAIESTL